MKKWKKRVLEDPLFHEFTIERNLSETTKRKYLTNLTSYCIYNKMTLTELFEEADNEEEGKIRAKRRKIVKRLKGYRNYLIEHDMSKLTISTRFTDIKTFYRHLGIEIPYIPPTNIKQEYQEMYDDIPTIKHIQKAVEATNNLKAKALFMFCASSGTARKETASLTIEDFIKATKYYHDEINDIDNVIERLDNRKDVIPLFKMTRYKTNYKYYTCCSPEATQAIIIMLQSREQNRLDDLLFGKSHIIGQTFQRINDKLNWGKKGNYNFFGCHKLRKFNATALQNTDLVNTIHGRKRSPVFEAYFKQNPEQIRKEYSKHLDKVTINKTKTFTIKSKEYIQLENENKELKENQERTNDRLAQIESKLSNIDPGKLEHLLNQK